MSDAWLLFRAEWLKLTRSHLFLVTAVLVVVFAGLWPSYCAVNLAWWNQDTCATAVLTWPRSFYEAIAYADGASAPLAMLLFSWFLGAEFGRDTWKMSLPRRAARWPFVVMKGLVSLMGVLLICALSVLGWTAVGVVAGPLVGVETTAPSAASASVDVLAQLEPEAPLDGPHLFEEYVRIDAGEGVRIEHRSWPVEAGAAPTIALGEGLSARVPATLGADESGTLPRGSGPGLRGEAGFSARNRTTRLAALMQGAAVLHAFHPWLDRSASGFEAQVIESLSLTARDATPTAGLRRLLAPLQDGHGLVSHPADVQLRALPWTWAPVGTDLVITAVAATGAGGVRPGDRVVRWQGAPIEDWWPRWLQSAAGGSEGCRRSVAVDGPGGWLGPAGAEVEVEVEALDGERRTVRVAYQTAPGSVRAPRIDSVARLSEDAWYVDLSRIDDREWRRFLPRLAAAERVLLDLRGYPGRISLDFLRNLSETSLRSDRFEAPVWVAPGEAARRVGFAWHLEPRRPHLSGTLVFLAGPESISYAESILGVAQRQALGPIVGQTTCGANGNIADLRLVDGTQLRFTGMDTLGPDGASRNRVGIQPTVPVSRTRAGIAEGRDEVLEAALTVLDDTH